LTKRGFSIYDIPGVEKLEDGSWEVIILNGALPRLRNTYEVDESYVPWFIIGGELEVTLKIIEQQLTSIRNYSFHVEKYTKLLQKICCIHFKKMDPFINQSSYTAVPTQLLSTYQS
jgi:hypothetical protein